MLVDRDKLIRTAECLDEDLKKQNDKVSSAAQAVKIVAQMLRGEDAIPVTWIQEYLEVLDDDLEKADPIRKMMEVWDYEVRTGHTVGYRR